MALSKEMKAIADAAWLANGTTNREAVYAACEAVLAHHPEAQMVSVGKFFRCLDCGYNGTITQEEIAKHRSRCATGTTEGLREPAQPAAPAVEPLEMVELIRDDGLVDVEYRATAVKQVPQDVIEEISGEEIGWDLFWSVKDGRVSHYDADDRRAAKHCDQIREAYRRGRESAALHLEREKAVALRDVTSEEWNATDVRDGSRLYSDRVNDILASRRAPSQQERKA